MKPQPLSMYEFLLRGVRVAVSVPGAFSVNRKCWHLNITTHSHNGQSTSLHDAAHLCMSNAEAGFAMTLTGDLRSVSVMFYVFIEVTDLQR